MKTRPSIGLLMMIILCGVGLGLIAAGLPSTRRYAAYVGMGYGLIILAHTFWFVVFPRKPLDRLAGKDNDRRRRLLKMVVATPSLFGREIKLLPRLLLFQHHKASGDLEDAVAEAGRLLALKPGGGLESDIRRQLADCLERLGRVAEADEERRRAEACLPGAGSDFMERLARGKLLEGQNRHAEAYDAYEQGLALVPDWAEKGVRVAFMAHLMLAAFNAGRPGDTVRWAEAVIASGDEGQFRLSAHGMAGVAYGELGQLDRAESHRRRALELAEASGDPAAVAPRLAQLADIERKRGKLAEAELSCRKAEALFPGGHEIYGTWAEVLRSQGRFDEALARVRQADPTRPLPVPALDRRVRAVVLLATSKIEADLRRWGDAEAHLREAAQVLDTDPKLSVRCEATWARVLAGLGRRDEAVACAERAEAGLADFPDDRSTRLGVLSLIGRAALQLGEFAQAERLWAVFLASEPDPVDRPLGSFYQGEALLGLGRVADARDAFRRSCSEGLDTHHARLARSRLEADAGEPAQPNP